MKQLGHVCPAWDRILNQIRALVNFFRNKTWRFWLRAALAPAGVAPRLFRRFTATVAKWRYGTVPLAMEQLLRLREVCERHLSMDLLAASKDRADIKIATEAAHDPQFWVFLNATYTHV